MKRVLGIVLVAALFLGALGIASAAPKKGSAGGSGVGISAGSGISAGAGIGFGGMLGRIANYLGLSSEQQEKLLKLQQDFTAKTQDLRFALQQKMLELRQLWSQDKLDEAAISQKSGEAAALRARLLEEKRAQLDNMKQVLTSEQQKKLDELTSNPQAARQGFRKGGFGRGGMRGGFGAGMGRGTGVCPWM